MSTVTMRITGESNCYGVRERDFTSVGDLFTEIERLKRTAVRARSGQPRYIKVTAKVSGLGTLGARWQSDATSSKFVLDGEQYVEDMKELKGWAARHALS